MRAGEIPTAEADRRKPSAEQSVGGKQACGPQHEVKPGASTEKQSESRAGHVAAKAMSPTPATERVEGLGGVRGAARMQGGMLNSGDPSARLLSQQARSYKPKAKSSRAQRESEGADVLMIATTNNVAGGKGPCFGSVGDGGKREGMAGKTGPNHPRGRKSEDKVRQLQRRLWVVLMAS